MYRVASTNSKNSIRYLPILGGSIESSLDICSRQLLFKNEYYL